MALALQFVSGCRVLLYIKPADEICSWSPEHEHLCHLAAFQAP